MPQHVGNNSHISIVACHGNFDNFVMKVVDVFLRKKNEICNKIVGLDNLIVISKALYKKIMKVRAFYLTKKIFTV